MWSFRHALVSAAFWLTASPPVLAASFFGLGTTPGKSHSIAPRAVTPDRQVVVAEACATPSSMDPCEPFLWTPATGAIALPLLAGDADGSAWGISADGGTVVGISQDSPTSGFGRAAVRWIDGGAPIRLAEHSDSIRTFAMFVTPDASVIAGTRTQSFGETAFAWTEATGLLQLLDPSQPVFDRSLLTGMSLGGEVVATLDTGNSPTASRTLRWTQAAGIEVLAIPPGYASSDAVDVAEATGAIAGNLWVGNPGVSAGRAYAWTSATGISPLPLPPEHLESRATHISVDGSAVAGHFVNPGSSALESEAFRWTEATGIESLGPAPGFDSTHIWRMHDDGALVVGTMSSELVELAYQSECGSIYELRVERRPFVWSETSPRIDLPHLPSLPAACEHNFWTVVDSVAADGSIAFGFSRCDEPDLYFDVPDPPMGCWIWTQGGLSHETWFAWDSVHGFRTLNDYVEAEHGIDLTGWTLTTASVSEDGQFLSGVGTHDGHREGWVLYVPEPHVELGLASGCALLAALSSRRRQRAKAG